MSFSPAIERIIDDIVKTEGGYVNDVRDRGGATRWGVTEAVARANGYTGPMASLPLAKARDIYARRYIIGPGFDAILPIAADIAAELVDTGVNMGPLVATRFLQRALNGLNANATRWPELVVDGLCGPATIAALTAFKKQRGRAGLDVLLTLLNALQAEHYLRLAEARPTNEAFLYGWLANRVKEPSHA